MNVSLRIFGSLTMACALAMGCSDSGGGSDKSVDLSGEGPLYLVTTSVTTADGVSTDLVWTPSELTTEAMDVKNAMKVPGGNGAEYFNGSIYIANADKKDIQRFEITSSGLQGRETISFADRGVEWVDMTFVSPDRAFTFSDAQLQYIEWNPSTMTITKTHDLSALKKEGWGYEFRDAIVRKSDGKIFFYFAYTNSRTSFLNEFTLGVFDTKSDSLKVLNDASCPTSAGFGGYVDEKDDFYAFADNFGLFTQLGATEVKKACVLRVKSGEDSFDPSYRFLPSDSIGGKAPWGYYYLGNNKVFTSVVDVANSKHDSVFGLLFAPEHSGSLIDTQTGAELALPELPLAGVGFQPFGVDDSLLVSRTNGTADDNEAVDNADSTVYRITEQNGQGKSEALFRVPGFVGNIQRIR